MNCWVLLVLCLFCLLGNITAHDEVSQCLICFDEFTSANSSVAHNANPKIRDTLFGCSHASQYHVNCIKKWGTSNPTCPTCRHQMNMNAFKVDVPTVHESDNCLICMEKFTDSQYRVSENPDYDIRKNLFKCKSGSHAGQFHLSCIKNWAKSQQPGSCPTCREKLNGDLLKRISPETSAPSAPRATQPPQVHIFRPANVRWHPKNT